MGVDDLLSTESAVVAAATAAIFSPRTRETVRRGAVLGVAGALKAGDLLAGAARGAARGMKSVGQEAAHIASDAREMASDEVDAAGAEVDAAGAEPAVVSPSPAKPRAKSATSRPRSSAGKDTASAVTPGA